MDAESHLVDRARNGDEDAFMELVTIYKPRITKMASRFGNDAAEVGDLTQEIFLEVWRSISGYRGKAPFEHWISKVALNRCRKFLRREYKRRKQEVVSEHAADSVSETATDARRNNDAKEVLANAMTQLKPDDALVLNLRELEGYSLQEVADLTGWSIASVKVKTHRARQRLREILEKTGEWP